MAAAALPFTLELTLAERFRLVNMIPQQGDVVTLQRGQELKGRLIPTEDESREWKVIATTKADGNIDITWTPEGAAVLTPIHIGETMFDVFAKMLKERNDAKSLTLEDLSLYNKLVELPATAASNGKSPLEARAEVKA